MGQSGALTEDERPDRRCPEGPSAERQGSGRKPGWEVGNTWVRSFF